MCEFIPTGDVASDVRVSSHAEKEFEDRKGRDEKSECIVLELKPTFIFLFFSVAYLLSGFSFRGGHWQKCVMVVGLYRAVALNKYKKVSRVQK